MANKHKDIRWKWFEDKGYNLYSDEHQSNYVQSLFAPVDTLQGVFCEAKAGTGKTTLAVMTGVYEVENGTYDKIIYVRNAIPVRDQGFLPGGISEKEMPFMAPLIQGMDCVQPGLYNYWLTPNPETKQPRVIATTTSYTRGVTWDNAFVIFDEAQSFDIDELQTGYTRCTKTCKVVTIGSLRQNDNRKQRKIAGYTPFEIFMKHFEGQSAAYHTLVNVYRGKWADHADNVQDTIDKLSGVKKESGNE